MKKVVLFKSESDGSDKFVDILEKNNFSVISIPSIEFNFKSFDELLSKLKRPDDYEGIIFTSPRSIYATQQAVSTDNNVLKFWTDKVNLNKLNL
jgi:uroporphyrinogen-III synthase